MCVLRACMQIKHVHGHAAYYVIACNCTCVFLWLLYIYLDVQYKVCTAPSHCTAYTQAGQLASAPRVLHNSASFIKKRLFIRTSQGVYYMGCKRCLIQKKIMIFFLSAILLNVLWVACLYYESPPSGHSKLNSCLSDYLLKKIGPVGRLEKENECMNIIIKWA